MMKTILPLLTIAASISADRLGTSQHEGVEEVGDQIEHFPRELVYAERRMEVVGEEMDEVEEQIKQYSPDLDLPELLGPSFYGESDQNDRRDASTTCSGNQAPVIIKVNTDAYGYETSVVLKDSSNRNIFTAPEQGSGRLGKNQAFVESMCLAPGDYTLRMKDTMGDGLCCEYGQGGYSVSVNGAKVVDVSGVNANWKVKDHEFTVAIGSSRWSTFNSGNSNGGSSSNNVSVDNTSPSFNFQSKSCYDTEVYTKVDKYGYETSWQIKNSSGRTVASMGAVIAPNDSKTVSAGCLAPGKYTLTFNDFDGVCCRNGDGEFKLMVDGKELVNGGSWVGEISHDFKVGHDWTYGMSSRDWAYLNAHNSRRQDWHTRCNNKYCNKKYRPLKWSKGLAADAANYAERLLDTCEETGIHHDPGIEQGDNLAKNKGSGNWGELYDAEKIVKRFIDNEEFWGWNRNAHLTQGLWYATKYIGCAESVKSLGGNKMCRFQVCRYAKAGNCEMTKKDKNGNFIYNANQGDDWMIPMMADDSACGPVCPPEGCYL
jgi:hypothetical protein